MYSPYGGAGGTVLPVTAEEYVNRDNNFVMKIDTEDYAYRLFTEHGFVWGGSWESPKDYQHFEKSQ